MVNAHVVYRKDSQRKISLLDFMKSGIKLFTGVESEPQRGRQEHYDCSLAIERQHFAAYIEDGKQHRCKQCLKNQEQRDVRFFCSGCPGNPALCLTCFAAYHQ